MALFPPFFSQRGHRASPWHAGANFKRPHTGRSVMFRLVPNPLPKSPALV